MTSLLDKHIRKLINTLRGYWIEKKHRSIQNMMELICELFEISLKIAHNKIIKND